MTALMNLLFPRRLAAAAALLAVAWTTGADAELVLRDLDVTVDGGEFTFDLDQDGTDDFNVLDDGAGRSNLVVINGGASLIVDPQNPVTSPIVYSPGDHVEAEPESLNPFGVTLFDTDGGVFSDVGATGFVGLAVTDESDNVLFGFVEITRGSTILGQVGYETTPGAAAVIPIPEPSATAILVAGFAAAWRRRRSRT